MFVDRLHTNDYAVFLREIILPAISMPLTSVNPTMAKITAPAICGSAASINMSIASGERGASGASSGNWDRTMASALLHGQTLTREPMMKPASTIIVSF